MQAVSATTFLFTDIEGSTRLWERDPGRMSVALARHDAIARSVVQANQQPEAALEHGRAVITRLDVLGAGANAGYLKWIVMIALMLLDRLDEAIVAGRAASTLLLHEGDEYRLLAALALLAALQGRIADAARIIGYDDANLPRTGGVVRPIAALLRARLEPLLTSGLSASERARLQAEGAAMRDDQVFELGFFQGGNPAVDAAATAALAAKPLRR